MKLKKTYIQAFASGCPKQFADVYIHRVYELPRNPAMIRGQNFHDWAAKFFEYAKWEELQELKTLEDIVGYFRLFVPKDVAEEGLKKAMFNFCEFEAKHVLAVRKPELGPRYFYPLEREFVIDTKTLDCHIDRIDLLDIDNCICPMEYKLMHTWSKWTFSYIRRELVFYSIALNVIPKYKGRAKYIGAYNPLLDKFFFEHIHRNTVAAVIRWVHRLKDSVEKGDFPRKPGPRCTSCPSIEECYLEDENVPMPIV